MRGSEFLDKMDLVDPMYIEAADRSPVQTRRRYLSRPMAACIALVLLIFAAGTTAVATGLYDDLLLYFKGNTAPFMEGIIDANTSVSNEEMTLRIDGAIADSHACYMIVSLTGHTAEARKEIQKFELWERVGLDTYAISDKGLKLTEFHWGLSVHRIKTGWRKYSMSRFEDTDATYVVSCEIGKDYPMDSIDRLCITYGDLTAELNIQDYRIPEYSLVCAEGETPEISNGFISSVGMYFDVPVEAVSPDNRKYPLFEIRMIRTDGSIEENLPFGFSCGTGYNADDKFAPVFGSWKQEGAHNIFILDLSDYQGIQINGVCYRFQ